MNDNDTTLITGSISKQIKKLVIEGREIHWINFDAITSTMDYAVKITKEGCEPWTVISADTQISGRGTHGRTWFSPGGKGLWISVILPRPFMPESMKNLSIVAAESLIESFNDFTELQFMVKHPNDVIVNGRKIAGIIIESVTSGNNVISLVMGMGVNFYQTREDFENEGLVEATSLLIENGSVPDRDSFITSFLSHFIPVYENSVLGYSDQQTS